MKILVTGGTGHLGRQIVSDLQRDGHEVRVFTRTPRADPDIEWARGNLATGDGIQQAVAGADAVIHAATNSPAAQHGGFKLGDFVRSPSDVDVGGTKALLDAARHAGVGHFLHVSTVGLKHMRLLSYSRRKLQAEALIRSSEIPWSIVRARAPTGCSNGCSPRWPGSRSLRCRRRQLWRRWTPMRSRHTSSSASLTGNAANAKALPDHRQ